jgi:hypothetical protein
MSADSISAWAWELIAIAAAKVDSTRNPLNWELGIQALRMAEILKNNPTSCWTDLSMQFTNRMRSRRNSWTLRVVWHSGVTVWWVYMELPAHRLYSELPSLQIVARSRQRHQFNPPVSWTSTTARASEFSMLASDAGHVRMSIDVRGWLSLVGLQILDTWSCLASIGDCMPRVVRAGWEIWGRWLVSMNSPN